MSEVHFITKLWHTREVCFECALKYSFQDKLEKKKLLQSARNFDFVTVYCNRGSCFRKNSDIRFGKHCLVFLSWISLRLAVIWF